MKPLYLLVATSALHGAAGLLDRCVPQHLAKLTVHSAVGLAHPYIARSDYKEAYAILYRALDHAPKAPQQDRHTFYAQIGQAAFQTGKFMDAATYYAESFKADPTEIDSLGKLIKALASETTSEKSNDSVGLLREATSYVQQALETLPLDPRLNLWMGKIYMITATKWLQRAQKELKPRNPNAQEACCQAEYQQKTPFEREVNLVQIQMHNVLRGITHF